LSVFIFQDKFGKKLGAGAFGTVWRARKDGKEFAVKVVKKDDYEENFAKNIKFVVSVPVKCCFFCF
jgi:serine/threonine protein kinase